MRIGWMVALVSLVWVGILSGEAGAIERGEEVREEEILEGASRLRCAETPIFWCSGGIGIEERWAMRMKSAQFTLCVEWALYDRPYLGQGGIRVFLPDGRTLVSAEEVGPWWCAAITPGSYRLVVEGIPLVEFPPQSRIVEVRPGRLQRITFFW